jgi:hypothetical protein
VTASNSILWATRGNTLINLKELGYCFEGKHTTQDLTVRCNGGKGNGYNEISIKECVIDSTTNKCCSHSCSEKPILSPASDADSTLDSDNSDEGMCCHVYSISGSDILL